VRFSNIGKKSSLVVSKLDSQLEGRGFESHPILDGKCVNAMPGLIPAILVHLIIEMKENTGSQMGHIKIRFFKDYLINIFVTSYTSLSK